MKDQTRLNLTIAAIMVLVFGSIIGFFLILFLKLEGVI